MPTDTSNFTMPDTGSGTGGVPVPKRQQQPGDVWDPIAQSWRKPGTGIDNNPLAYGGHGQTTDVNGNPIAGTSTAETDIARAQRMAGITRQAPTIDQTRSNETRGVQGGALGLLRMRAEGGITPAQELSRQMTRGVVAGVQSGAASIKGGAMARAAAARGATATGARLQAQGDQDTAALAAREQADAAGQYMGTTTAQRGQDLGVATDQAKLTAGNNTLNDQHNQFYAGQGNQVATTATLGGLGTSAEATNAANAQRVTAAGQAADAAAASNARTSGLVGAGTGAFNAYVNTKQPEKSDPNDPNSPNYTGSDPRMKRGITPIGVGHEGRKKAPKPSYDGKYLGSPFHDEPDVLSGEGRRAPHQASLEELAGDRGDREEGAPYPQIEDPRRYHERRAGQPGGMFGKGKAPEADYREMLWGPPDAPAHPKDEQAFYGAGNQGEAGRRDIAMSDPKAKQAAFLEGQRHAVQGLSFDDMPSYAKGEAAKGGREMQSFKREDSKDSMTFPQKVAARVLSKPGPDATMPEHALQTVTNGARAMAEYPGALIDAGRSGKYKAYEGIRFPDAPVEEKPLEPTSPAGPAPPGYFGQAMTSDPRAKTNVHDDPMADANRSMAPSSYEYKPEFTPPEQEQGEVNVGPMADKMKANPVAKTAIVTDPQSGLLAIDKTKGLKLVMGGLADLQRQVDRMREAR